MVNKQNLIEVAELRIWAYVNPFYWVFILIVFIIAMIAIAYEKTWTALQELWVYNTVKYADRERVEKFVESYYNCIPSRKKILLSKNTKAGRKLRNYTVKNIRRLKKLNTNNHE